MSVAPSGMVDLLVPTSFFKANYVYQVRQTIEAYSASKIVLGEALQNAIDAVSEPGRSDRGKISVEIDFDSESVTVRDNGVGFPPDTSFLFLGGTTKQGGGLKGKIGVGIKVTMFASEYFRLRSRTQDRAWSVEVASANEFESLASLEIPSEPQDDPNPLEEQGTEILYRFPTNGEQNYLNDLVDEIIESSVPEGVDKRFGDRILELRSTTGFPSPFAALLSSFLRRYTYVGDVLAALDRQGRYPERGIQLDFTIRCGDPMARFGERFGEKVSEYFGTEPVQSFTVEPKYLQVKDTLDWVPRGQLAPRTFSENLGPGGGALGKAYGFNKLDFASVDGYKSLVRDIRGRLPEKIAEYERNLFGSVNGISLTIGRIPEFEKYLPGGSRRVISCNGVVTDHDIDLTSGRNQEYVRCIDLIVDVDSTLNYGKTHLTNMRLVGVIRDFVNDAYRTVLQRAASNWVGKIPEEPENGDREVFTRRPNLDLPDFVTRKVPRDENDVIGLFFEMAGRGIFPEDQFRIFGMSQKEQYDCKAAILREADDPSILEPEDDTRMRLVDFKVHAEDIMRDFDKGQKSARELNLVIAWDLREQEYTHYAVYDIDQSAAYKVSPKRVFPHVSKYILDSREGAEVQVLLLEEVVAQLKANATTEGD